MVAGLNDEIHFIDGKMNFLGIPIEHAWNEYHGQYFDVTKEIALKESVDGVEYLSIGEFTYDYVIDVCFKRKFYGSILYEYFTSVNKNDSKTDVKFKKIGKMELMKIFFHMNVIDAVCIGILVLVLLVGLFCVFCQGITESIVKRRKRKARKLLSDELKKLNDDLQYYKEKWLGRQDIVLSKTIVSMILKFLPSPNECVNNLSIIEKNSKMNCGTF